MQRGIRSKEVYKDFSSKQIKDKLVLFISIFDAAGRTILDFFKFIDWTILSAIRSARNLVNAFKKFAPVAELRKATYDLNKFIEHTFPAERALMGFSILFVLAIAMNPWLSSSLFDQHFYSIGFKIFSDILFSISLLGAVVNAYSFIAREFRRFKTKQLKEHHQKLLEREKACRHKPVKNLHSLSR